MKIPHPFWQATLAMIACMSLQGCPMTNDIHTPNSSNLSKHINQLLAEKDSTVIEAGKLTDFSWKQLCFERDEKLLLKFDADENEQVIALDYEQFFVTEPYVERSLAERCVNPTDLIEVRRKYPGYNDQIEFRLAK
ncbi:MAG: hypothetical protein Q4G62_00610 [Pseudomonadota bacterium]|nr:hypothetical protein [Pseudomonadota bacterium]